MDERLTRVGSILVVGGGTSGWMAASFLSKVLKTTRVTLIESARTPTIGVGEATIPFIRNFMTRIGYPNDRDWMPSCDATFKTGILFDDWYTLGDRYWHPFEYLDYLDLNTHTGHWWLYLRDKGLPLFRERRSFYSSFFPSMLVNVEHNRIPWRDEYAYHLDAGRFVEFLRSVSPDVQHLRDDVVSVETDGHSRIEHVKTQNSGPLTADLYIDCSGFRSLLLRSVAPELRWQSYEKSLFCDRAIALRLPYVDEEDRQRRLVSYVLASAREAGWIWTIPLSSRVGTGYVYSSSFISDDDAEDELRRFVGVERAAGFDSLRIQFRIGKYERSWVGNCVAIGLATGFIEPLESPSLAIVQTGVELLASMLDAGFASPAMIDRYNGYLDKFYDDILQFLIPHYSLSARDDSEFWRHVRNDTVVPGELAARLDVFREYLPTADTKGMSEPWMFRDISWFSVLLGMNFPFRVPKLDDAGVGRIQDLLAAKRKQVDRLVESLPTHSDYLDRELYLRG